MASCKCDDAAVESGTLLGTEADDAYHSVVELFGFPQLVARIVAGTLQVQGFGATLRYNPRRTPAPDTTLGGTAIAAGAGLGYQASDRARLDELWLRNTVAGSNATIVFSGTWEAGK